MIFGKQSVNPSEAELEFGEHGIVFSRKLDILDFLENQAQRLDESADVFY